jgi:hypothetical protein
MSGGRNPIAVVGLEGLGMGGSDQGCCDDASRSDEYGAFEPHQEIKIAT